MVITTSYKPDEAVKQRAIFIANQLNSEFIERGKLSLEEIMLLLNHDEMIVVEQKQTKYYQKKMTHPFFFHPSLALLRINRLKQGDNDVMIEIAGLKEGDSFLDCTLGLASDSIVASFVVGDAGKVVGLESQKRLAVLVQDGLIRGWDKDFEVHQAMKRIEVQHIDHLEKLRKLPDRSFDIVYFDPMFRSGIKKSSSIQPLRSLANPNEIGLESIKEAARVAKRKVILKENIRSREFERLGFRKIPRNSSITYGIIDINGVEKP